MYGAILAKHLLLVDIQCAPSYVFFIKEKMRVCLSVLGAAKIESGYNARCISFWSVMVGACAGWTALMNRLENNF